LRVLQRKCLVVAQAGRAARPEVVLNGAAVDFVIYLKAKALGLELSPSLVGLADEVIEMSTPLSFLTPRRTFAVQIYPR
jgi:hypothetical protein